MGGLGAAGKLLLLPAHSLRRWRIVAQRPPARRGWRCIAGVGRGRVCGSAGSEFWARQRRSRLCGPTSAAVVGYAVLKMSLFGGGFEMGNEAAAESAAVQCKRGGVGGVGSFVCRWWGRRGGCCCWLMAGLAGPPPAPTDAFSIRATNVLPWDLLDCARCSLSDLIVTDLARSSLLPVLLPSKPAHAPTAVPPRPVLNLLNLPFPLPLPLPLRRLPLPPQLPAPS